jgi:hypothetical protein
MYVLWVVSAYVFSRQVHVPCVGKCMHVVEVSVCIRAGKGISDRAFATLRSAVNDILCITTKTYYRFCRIFGHIFQGCVVLWRRTRQPLPLKIRLRKPARSKFFLYQD